MSFLWFRFRSFFDVFWGVRLCFSCPFLALGAGRRAALFSVGLFGCVFVCVFSSFWAFFGPFLVLGAGRRAALFSVGLFGCVLVFSFFMKAILSFVDFLAIFCFFFFSFLP